MTRLWDIQARPPPEKSAAMFMVLGAKPIPPHPPLLNYHFPKVCAPRLAVVGSTRSQTAKGATAEDTGGATAKRATRQRGSWVICRPPPPTCVVLALA